MMLQVEKGIKRARDDDEDEEEGILLPIVIIAIWSLITGKDTTNDIDEVIDTNKQESPTWGLQQQSAEDEDEKVQPRTEDLQLITTSMVKEGEKER